MARLLHEPVVIPRPGRQADFDQTSGTDIVVSVRLGCLHNPRKSDLQLQRTTPMRLWGSGHTSPERLSSHAARIHNTYQTHANRHQQRQYAP